MFCLPLDVKLIFEHDFGLDFSGERSFIEDVSRIVDEEPYQGQLRLFLRAMEGKPQAFELPLKTIHGESRWYQVFLNPVSLGEGQRTKSMSRKILIGQSYMKTYFFTNFDIVVFS